MALNWTRAKLYASYENSKIANEVSSKDIAATWLERAERRVSEQEARKTSRVLPDLSAPAHAGVLPVAKGAVSAVEIYTDGACNPNPGKGGWAFVVVIAGNETASGFGGQRSTTNNAMEMTAVLKALEWLGANARGRRVVIYSDSQYVVKGCNSWRGSWKRHGWTRKNDAGQREPVKNADLWKKLDAALDVPGIKIEWVKGHAGNIGNERADRLSCEGRRRV